MPLPEPHLLPASSEFNLRKFLDAVREKFWIVVGIVLITMTAVIYYNSTLVPVYRATTQLMIEIPQSTGAESKEAQQGPAIGSGDYFNTQYEILKSLSLSRRVATELKLDSLPEFSGQVPEIALLSMISVEPIKKSLLVNVSVDCANAELAAKITNAIADTYVRQNVEGMTFMSRELLKTISGENQIAGSQPLTEADKEKMVEMLPSVKNDPALQSRRAERAKIEAEIADLSKRYKSKHPKIISLNTRLESVNGQIKKRTADILSNVKADLQGKFRINNIRVVERAEVPRYPQPSKKVLNLLLGGVLSLFLSLWIIYFLEKMDKSVKTQEDVQHHLRLPFLGNFPHLKKLHPLQDGIAQLEKIDKDMLASTAIREIRTGLLYAHPDKPSFIASITSTVPKEGKSFLAAYLAFSFAKSGSRTLLIDADLRLPSIHRLFGINHTPGLGNLLNKEVPPEQAILKTSSLNLSVLPAGESQEDPGELFGSEEMKQLMQDLSKDYERIIIDSPPSLLIPDTLVLSKVVDMTILVVRSGMIELETLAAVKGKFEAIGSVVTAFILNDLDLRKNTYYNRYYKSYYRSHGEKVSQHEKK